MATRRNAASGDATRRAARTLRRKAKSKPASMREEDVQEFLHFCVDGDVEAVQFVLRRTLEEERRAGTMLVGSRGDVDAELEDDDAGDSDDGDEDDGAGDGLGGGLGGGEFGPGGGSSAASALSCGLVFACETGQLSVIAALLGDARVSVLFEDGACVDACCEHGQEAALALLLDRSRAELKPKHADIAARHDRPEMLRMVLTAATERLPVSAETLQIVAQRGLLDVLRVLLDVDAAGVDDHDQLLLRTACGRGSEETVAFLLAASDSAPPAQALVQAASRSTSTPGLAPGPEGAAAAVAVAVAVVGLLLRDARVDVGANHNEALRRAVEYDCVEVVRLLLEQGADASEPSADEDENALVVACTQGNLELVELLLPLVDPNELEGEALVRAAAHGRWEVAQALLADGRTEPNDDALIEACSAGFSMSRVARVLLEDGRFDPTAADNQAIVSAAAVGTAHTVRLLLDDGRADPRARDNEALVKAAEQGNLEVVDVLLRAHACDVRARHSEALRSAAFRGRLDVVERLVQGHEEDDAAAALADVNDRPDKAAMQKLLARTRRRRQAPDFADLKQSSAAGLAAAAGHVETLRFLLAHGGDPSLCNSYGIFGACKAGSLDAVRLLIGDARCDAGAADNRALIAASKNVDVGPGLVAALLGRDGVDAGARDDEALVEACAKGSSQVAALLLRSGGANPNARGGDVLREAVRKGQLRVLRALVRSAGRKVDFAAFGDELLVLAAGKENASMVELILAMSSVISSSANVSPGAKVSSGSQSRSSRSRGRRSSSRRLKKRSVGDAVNPAAESNRPLLNALSKRDVATTRVLVGYKGVQRHLGPLERAPPRVRDAYRFRMTQAVRVAPWCLRAHLVLSESEDPAWGGTRLGEVLVDTIVALAFGNAILTSYETHARAHRDTVRLVHELQACR